MKSKPIIFLVCLTLVSFSPISAPQKTITGTVVAKTDGLALPGVNVSIKGTSTGTQTDFDGKYSIEAKTGDVLVFSFVSMQTLEKIVGTSNVIDIVMEDDSATLDEVIVEVEDMEMVTPTAMIKKNKPNATYVQTLSGMTQGLNITVVENESYSEIKENDFKDALKIPLSTFSVDVDGASYSNVRRQLNDGYLPNKNSVRIEEMINYFNYNYQEPKKNVPFSINTELSHCPWNDDNLLLHVGLKGKSIEMENLPPSNIVFLLDVSGSMSSRNKLPLLKSSLKLLLETLRPQDRVAIVTYAGSSGLVLPSTRCDEKKTILDALNRLEAGGSTAGGAGLKLAYKVANENFIKKGNNRIILATDGDFNVGIQNKDAMKMLVEAQRDKGTAISVLGFGMGNYKDDMMEIIANNGNGNYAYIDNLLEAQKVLVNEFGGTFYTIAKDVKFQLEFNPMHVDEYRLIGYENRLLADKDFNDDTKDAGEIGAGHTVTALYEIVPMAGKTIEDKGLNYQTPQLTEKALKSNDLITLKLRYKEPDGDKSKLIEKTVKNSPNPITKTSNSFRFSAAVAEFGMLLRDSKYKADLTWDAAYELASNAKGKDKQGYRSEMTRLINSAKLLSMDEEH